MNTVNRQWLLKRRPVGVVSADDFEYAQMPLSQAALNEGEVLVKVLCLGFDPAMRGWMDDVPSYLPPAPLGQPMRASGIGKVVRSANPGFEAGDLVQGLLGWQEYCLNTPDALVPLHKLPEGTPVTMALSVFGSTSLTAYFGLLDVGQPKAGETVVVSGAAGATGSVAAQIARIMGCRVIGIAGSAEKCAWLEGDCKLDATVNYRTENVSARLAELCPGGIDVFFDNVGGDMLQAAVDNIAGHGRIVLCGQIATYNDAEPRPGPRNLFNLVTRSGTMQGFVLMDYLDRTQEALDDLVEWVMNGQVAYREDIQHGFENIPATFLRLFSGENSGKQLLMLAED